MTLTEVMVGMVIMTIFMSIFTTSIISMFSSSNKVQASENSSAQLNTAFDRLDKQVRYASVIDPVINVPYPSVSFLTPATSAAAGPTCTQVAILTSVTGNPLKERSWPQATPGAATGWSQLALGISLVDQNGAAVTPFSIPTISGAIVQQLHLQLVAKDGTGQATTYSTSSVTFSALNAALANVSQTPACPAPVAGA
jgi:type II secretory pathway pseudopilin PulG